MEKGCLLSQKYMLLACKYNLMVPANRKKLFAAVFICAAGVKISTVGTGQ
jgi:hypothetical protein